TKSLQDTSDRLVHRILMRSARPFQHRTRCQYMLEKGIVIENEDFSGILTKGSLQILHDRPKTRLRKWIEKVEHNWISREVELAGVAPLGFKDAALLLFTGVLPKVLGRNPVQFRQKFDTDDFSKRIIRSHQQRPAFPRT